VHVAARPPDYEHRFGHGKAEALAALFQMMLVTLAAVGIVIRSVEQFGGQHKPGAPGEGMVVSLLAIVLTLALVSYQARIIRLTGSIAISADNLHYRSDLLLNGAVIAALALEAWAGIRGADAAFGILIGLWLGWTAWHTATRAIDQLMDKEWPIEKRERFLAVMAAHPGLEGVHDLRTRTSGNRDFAQFHLWMDPQMSLASAHQLMEDVEMRLRREFPGTDIIIHPDPAGHIDAGDALSVEDARALIAEEKATQ
jgi:ferrous-iron efflux pump FieF